MVTAKKKRSKLLVVDDKKNKSEEMYIKVKDHLNAIFDGDDKPSCSDEFLAGITSSLEILLPINGEEIADLIIRWREERERGEAYEAKMDIAKQIRKRTKSVVEMFKEASARNDFFDILIKEIIEYRYNLDYLDKNISVPKRGFPLGSFMLMEYEETDDIKDPILHFYIDGDIIGSIYKTGSAKTPYRSISHFYTEIEDEIDIDVSTKEGNHSSYTLAINKVIENFFSEWITGMLTSPEKTIEAEEISKDEELESEEE